MAREISVRVLCDVHLAEDEHEDGVELPPLSLAPGRKPRVLALCDVHRKELYDPLAAALAELGQAPDTTGPGRTSKPRELKTGGGTGGEHKCPILGCEYPGGPTQSALQTHVREHHDTTLAEALGQPAAYVCPECERGYATPQGLGAHRFRAHGVKGSSTSSTFVVAARRAAAAAVVEADPEADPEADHPCPECGRGFATSGGLGMHRWRAHGVKGARHTLK